MSLEWKSGNTYELTLKVLRDCYNGKPGFDGTGASGTSEAMVGIFDLANNKSLMEVDVGFPTITNLKLAGPDCANPPDVCTQLGVYKKTIFLNPSVFKSSKGYYFAYERCCRNNIIKNIVSPGDVGIAVYMEVPPLGAQNSTPSFSSNPFTYLCKNNIFSYNMNFEDPDGDSLHYSMVAPLNSNLKPGTPSSPSPPPGPYPDVQWFPTYGVKNEIKGVPPLNINPVDGEITVNPTEEGIYVAAFKVEEFRLGKKLGEVHLELQFNVTNCEDNIFPSISFKNDDGRWGSGDYSVQIPEKLCFNILIDDIKDSLDISIKGPAWTNDTHYVNSPRIDWFKQKALKTATARVCWQPTCHDLDSGVQEFQITVKDNGCPIPKTSTAVFTITPTPMPLVNPIDMLCMTLTSDNETVFTYGDSLGVNKYFGSYHIYRALNRDTFVLYDSTSERNSKSIFIDPSSPDNKRNNYRYFIRAVNACGFEGPSSDTAETGANLKPTPEIQKLRTVTVEKNKYLKLIWPESWEQDFARYFLYKSTRDNEDFKLLADFNRITDTAYYDMDVNVQEHSYCYYLIMKDTCDNYGPVGKKSCSILLKGESSPFESHVNWTPYNFWDNGTQIYLLNRADHLNPFGIVEQVDPGSDKVTDDKLNTRSGKFRYFLDAIERPNPFINTAVNSSGQFSRSNEIELIQAPVVYVPNAYSANDDGNNDTWGIRDLFVKDFDLRVYNKWGQLIFQTHDKNVQWDGRTLDGTLAQSDVYIYLVSYSGWDNSFFTKKGNVTLLH